MKKCLLLGGVALMTASLLSFPTTATAQDYQSAGSVDFEDESTVSDGWTISSTDITASQQTRSDGETHFLRLAIEGLYTGGTISYPITSNTFTNAEEWKMEIELAFSAAYLGTTSYIYFVANSDSILTISMPTTSTEITVSNKAGTSLATLTGDNYYGYSLGLNSTYTSGNSLGAGTFYTFTFTANSTDGIKLSITGEDGTSYLSDGTVADFANIDEIDMNFSKYWTAVGVDNIKYYVVSSEEIVEAPTASVTGVDGTSREVTMSCGTEGATIYYTANGGDEQTYSEPITISDTTTFVMTAKTETGGVSEETTVTLAAGEEIVLPDIAMTVSAMTLNDDGYYYPSCSFTCDNSDVLLTPDITLTATVGGDEITDFDGSYSFTETTSLVVTASAEGYTSSTYSIDGGAYELKEESTDYTSINSSNIEELLGSDWSITGPTRWASWSKTNGILADGSSNTDDTDGYYTATSYATSVDFEFVTIENADSVTLLIGYGFGSGNKDSYISIIDSLVVDNAIAEYDRCGYGTSYDTVYVTTGESSSLQYTIPKYYYTITSAKYYTPYSDDTDGISEVSADVESDDAQSAPVYSLSGVMVRKAGEGVSGLSKGVYIMNGKKFCY